MADQTADIVSGFAVAARDICVDELDVLNGAAVDVAELAGAFIGRVDFKVAYRVVVAVEGALKNSVI